MSADAQDYEYRGLMAETWDYLRGDPTGRVDRDFYWALIQEFGQPVLDVGCGTGRLLLDFMAQGIDIDGVDVSPEMLALCDAKARTQGVSPTLYQAAIESMLLPRQYRTILAPSSVLQLIPDPAAARSAAARLYEHLIPDGALVAPFMTLWREGMPRQHEWENARVRERDGALLQRMSRVWYDVATECEHTEDLYQVLIDGEVVAAEHHRRSPAARSYTQAQARQLLEDAGFRVMRVLCGFTHAAATEDDMQFTMVATKEH